VTVAPFLTDEPAPADGGSAPGDEGAFLDALNVEDDGQGGGPAEDAAPVDPGAPADGFIGTDAFFAGFKVTHQLAGLGTGLRSLQEGPDAPGAREASDAIYACLYDTPSLHFLIQPGSLWMQRAAVIAAYAVPLGMSCKVELAQRRAARAKAAAERQATARAAAASRPGAAAPAATGERPVHWQEPIP
jgi:hypothetical protein